MSLNHIKGKDYEKFIVSYLNNDVSQVQNVYLWNDTPEQVLFDANLITDYNCHRLDRKRQLQENTLKDVGIDIVQLNTDNSIIFIE